MEHVRTRPGIVLALCSGLLLTVAACGPTAEQLAAREASPSAAVPAPVSSRSASPAPPPSVPAAPAPVSVAPARVGVTGSQAGMPEPVQDACQWLLRRDPAPVPGAEAGACVAAAMAAGEGGVQTLQTETSWLPGGTYTVRFSTSGGFAMSLEESGTDSLGIVVRDGVRTLRQEGSVVAANPDGSAEEAYAAVLADAAELTVRPERVAGLVSASDRLEIEYGAILDGAAYTRLSGSFDTGTAAAGEPEDDASLAKIPAGSVSVFLDDYYRPVRIELTGLNQGITSHITAVNTQWGTRPFP